MIYIAPWLPVLTIPLSSYALLCSFFLYLVVLWVLSSFARLLILLFPRRATALLCVFLFPAASLLLLDTCSNDFRVIIKVKVRRACPRERQGRPGEVKVKFRGSLGTW